MLTGIYACSQCGSNRTILEKKAPAACCGKEMKFISPLPTEERSCCEVR